MHLFYSPSIVWKDKILTPCSELLILSPFAMKGNHLDTKNQLKLKIKGGQEFESYVLSWKSLFVLYL